MSLLEVEDDSDYPIVDDRGINSLELSHMVNGRTLKHVGEINGFSLMSKFWPLSPDEPNLLFLMDGDRAVALFELYLGRQEGQFRTGYSFVLPEYRGKGLGFTTYAYLLSKNYVLESGHSHTRDSMMLWSKIAKDPRFEVTHMGKVINDTSVAYDGKRNSMVAKLRSS